MASKNGVFSAIYYETIMDRKLIGNELNYRG